MNILIKNSVRPVIFALSVGALFVSFGSSAYAGKIILDEAIDDYTAVPSTEFRGSPSMSRSGYDISFILEEAYHDYGEVTTFAHNEGTEGLERADIAAFEFKQRPMKTPWELNVVD